MAITKISEAEREAMKKKSAQSLPDVPSSHNLTPKDFKNAITKVLFDNKNSFYEFVNRLAEETSNIDLTSKETIFTEEQINNVKDHLQINNFNDYNKLNNLPTIEGLALKGGMIDEYAERIASQSQPFISELPPIANSKNIKTIWFDTSEKQSVDIDDETLEKKVEDIVNKILSEQNKTQSNYSQVSAYSDSSTTNGIGLYEVQLDEITPENELQVVENTKSEEVALDDGSNIVELDI